MFRLTIIVAATTSNGIGRQSHLPWRLPKEMKYFARVTTNAPEGCQNALIMGRNTWESIPKKFRPLSNRVNLVTSRNANYHLEFASEITPAHLCTSFASSLEQIHELGSASTPIYRTFVIGGASLYSESLALPAEQSTAVVDRILLTRILSPDFDCDVFMTDFHKIGTWKHASHEELNIWVGFEVPEGVQTENGVEYEFQMWTREI